MQMKHKIETANSNSSWMKYAIKPLKSYHLLVTSKTFLTCYIILAVLSSYLYFFNYNLCVIFSVLYATGARLLCQTWAINDRAFGSLQVRFFCFHSAELQITIHFNCLGKQKQTYNKNLK
jgi:hypothetical protein